MKKRMRVLLTTHALTVYTSSINGLIRMRCRKSTKTYLIPVFDAEEVIFLPDKKVTARERLSVRIDPAITLQARKIAKRDYGDESRISPVVEEALIKYIASELRGDEIATLLSATEGALYSEISKKIEKEFTDMSKRVVNRVGSLVAKQSYETTLNSLLLESLFYQSRNANKEKYELLRKEAYQRMKRRLENEGAEETQNLLTENERLEQENEELKSKVQELEKQLKQQTKIREESKEALEQINHNFKISEDLRKHYIRWINGLISYLQQNYSRLKPNEQLIKEYIQSNPKPKGM